MPSPCSASSLAISVKAFQWRTRSDHMTRKVSAARRWSEDLYFDLKIQKNTGKLIFNFLKQKNLIFNFFVNRNWKKLTDSRKRAKILADNRKSHHPIETLLQTSTKKKNSFHNDPTCSNPQKSHWTIKNFLLVLKHLKIMGCPSPVSFKYSLTSPYGHLYSTNTSL